MAELMVEADRQQQLEQLEQQPQPALAGDGAAAAPPLHAATTNTSVRFLRLQHDFRTMIKSGLDCVDEQTFVELFGGRAAPHQLRHTWRLLQQQCDSVVAEACAELGVACAEVGLQQQLEELEGLILQRGLLCGAAGSGDTGSAADPAALPAAAEAAAHVAAKRAEKQQLLSTLQQLQQQKALLEADLVVRQQQAEELVRDFKAVEDQVDKVYKASKCWLQPAADA